MKKQKTKTKKSDHNSSIFFETKFKTVRIRKTDSKRNSWYKNQKFKFSLSLEKVTFIQI